MGIFLNESFTRTASPSTDSNYLQRLSESLKIDEKSINTIFGNENAGMAICYESEVAWNTLMEEMKTAEFTALHEGALNNFWGKIKDWGKKVIAFFVKVWKAIVAWSKATWAKIVNVFVKSDEELVKRLKDLKGTPIVKREVYALFNPGVGFNIEDAKKSLQNVEKKAKEGLGALDKFNDEEFQKGIDVALDAIDKSSELAKSILLRKEERTISVKDCEAELTGFSERMKAIIDYLEDTDGIIAIGTKSAKEAQKNAEELLNADKDNDQLKKNVRRAVAITKMCQRTVNVTISNTSTYKKICFNGHTAYRSAAKEMIRTRVAKKD